MTNLLLSDDIAALVDAELAAYKPVTRADRLTLEEFKTRRRPPRLVTVLFSGGFEQKCWNIMRSDGTYRVVYMPIAGYFSLCVESDFGPLDIGVHGSAMGCFGSV